MQRKFDVLHMLKPVSSNKHWVADRNRHLAVHNSRKVHTGLGAVSKGNMASASTTEKRAHQASKATGSVHRSGAVALGRGTVADGNDLADLKRTLLKAADFPSFNELADFDQFADAVDDGRAASLMVHFRKARPKTTKASGLAGRRIQIQKAAVCPSSLAVVTRDESVGNYEHRTVAIGESRETGATEVSPAAAQRNFNSLNRQLALDFRQKSIDSKQRHTLKKKPEKLSYFKS